MNGVKIASLVTLFIINLCFSMEVIGQTGCTESTASNFDPNAVEDDGSCIIVDCTDVFACNYNSSATEHDFETCIYGALSSHAFVTSPGVYEIDASDQCGYYLASSKISVTSEFPIEISANFTCPNSVEHIYRFSGGSDDYIEHIINVASGIPSLTLQPSTQLFYGDHNLSIFYDETTTTIINDSDENLSINLYPMNVIDNPEFFDLSIPGCTDFLACNYNAEANCDNGSCSMDEDQDGICDIDEVLGCDDAEACNYNSMSTDVSECLYAAGCDICSGATDGTGIVIDLDLDDDGVCDDDEVEGCQEVEACNYMIEATNNVGCEYTSGCDSCMLGCDGIGFIIDLDYDDDGVCDDDELSGCTYLDACNYNELATDDDGSCHYNCYGCTDENAINYSSFATVDNGFCQYLPECTSDINGDSQVNSSDLTIFLSMFGVTCD